VPENGKDGKAGGGVYFMAQECETGGAGEDMMIAWWLRLEGMVVSRGLGGLS